MPDPTPTPPTGTFAYDAQSVDGRTYRGTLDAQAIAGAADQLASLHLRVTRLEPTERPLRRASLGEADFLFVNRQLAHLTTGGLPIEQGLRLIAAELPGRQARGVRAIAAELEAGVPFGDAFAGQGSSFPPIYGRLMDAGVRAHNLPGVLVNLGRHIEMVQRLRAAVWRAAAYPIVVAAALLVVLGFIWIAIIPRLAPVTRHTAFDYDRYYGHQYQSTDADLSILPVLAQAFSYGMMALLAIALLSSVAVALAGRTTGGRRRLGPLLRRLPIVGPVVRWNGVARWCDALYLGVLAGMDLPAALSLACEATDSAAVRADTQLMVSALQAGQPLAGVTGLVILPPMVPTALGLGVDQSDLPAAAATLARMYQEQAEARLAVVPQLLSPLLLMLTALSVGITVSAALVPLITLLQSISGPIKK
jgi:general secretion pathway protein F